MDFLKIPPQEIANLPKLAVKYLEDAINRTPGSTSRPDVFWDIAKKGYGNIYLIYDGMMLMGATYLLVHDTPEGKVVGIVLLGGRKMRLWIKEYYNFVREFQILTNSVCVRFIGRDGFAGVVPCRRIGGIYEADLR